jgi:hypothetical protein
VASSQRNEQASAGRQAGSGRLRVAGTQAGRQHYSNRHKQARATPAGRWCSSRGTCRLATKHAAVPTGQHAQALPAFHLKGASCSVRGAGQHQGAVWGQEGKHVGRSMSHYQPSCPRTRSQIPHRTLLTHLFSLALAYRHTHAHRAKGMLSFRLTLPQASKQRKHAASTPEVMAMSVMGPACPSSISTQSPMSRSHTRAVPSLEAAAGQTRPGGRADR